jgi:hypothetical protein
MCIQIVEGINFEIEAQSDNADKQQLQQLVKMAEERCPAMYSMKHEVKVNASINKSKNKKTIPIRDEYICMISAACHCSKEIIILYSAGADPSCSFCCCFQTFRNPL